VKNRATAVDAVVRNRKACSRRDRGERCPCLQRTVLPCVLSPSVNVGAASLSLAPRGTRFRRAPNVNFFQPLSESFKSNINNRNPAEKTSEKRVGNMAPAASELATLRALTFRIQSTSTSQLPQHVSAIAASLANCKSLLSSAQATNTKSAPEASVAVHKYRTILSNLVQDRTIQGRWAAIVLIKATIENGGWETLQKTLPWVRGLLGILTKPDPPSSKKLCLITLTRIFVLTREYPTLVREITTPNLPAFIQSSLQLASSDLPPGFLQTILECFNQLLPRHPTIFRTYLKQMHQLLGKIIAPTPSTKPGPDKTFGANCRATADVSAAARHLYTQLPCSAPKGASGEEWQTLLNKVIASAHRTSDKVFRAVIEDWKPSSRDAPSVNGHTLEDEVEDLEVDPMGLTPWCGIFAGGERLVGLLRLVRDHLKCTTSSPVSVSVGAVVDLITRFFSLTVPSSGNKGFQNTLRFNNQVGKEEREYLWLIVPDVHVAAIDILLALTRRCDISTSAIDAAMLDQLVYVFASERDTPRIRAACYSSVASLLKRSGIALPKSSIDPLGLMIRTCCDDILPSEQSASSSKRPMQQSKTNGNAQQTQTNADTFLSLSTDVENPAAMFKGLQEAAYELLMVVLANVRPQHLSDSTRSRLDRTAILVGHKDAMIASVLNQPPSRKFGKPVASIMPLLAHMYPSEQDVESLLRPRMPVVLSGGKSMDSQVDEEDENEEEEVEEDVEEETPDQFVGHALDTLLETAANTDSVSNDVAMTGANESAPRLVSIDTSAPSNHAKPTTIEEDDLPKSGGKRLQEEVAPYSPVKRAKVSEEPEAANAPSSITTMPTTVIVPVTANSSEIRSDDVPTSVASQAPISPAPPQAEDSDSDDVVSLVLGQDTDEDSE
jgi:pre-rRNA-processing protein RIX1